MKIPSVYISFFLILFASDLSAQVCAHRGDSESAPENTIAAFQAAVAKGAQQIEFDVAMTKDGHLVIMHDSTVSRTTNGRGKVAELTLQEIRSLDAGSWFAPEFKGEVVPTLREALEAIPKHIYCNVHLKGGESTAREAAKLIAEMGRLDRAFLACSVENIRAARQVVPEIKTCNMTRQSGNRALYIEETIDLGCEYIQLHQRDGYDNIAQEVALLHASGVTVNWFGVNDAALIVQLNRAGVDFVLTDRLTLAMKTIRNTTKNRSFDK